MKVLLADDTGGLTAGEELAVGAEPTCLVGGDFNGDRKLDLAVANAGANSVSILLGRGDGGLSRAPQDVTVGSRPESLAVADLDGDGDLDLAVANRGDDSVSVLLGNGAGVFSRVSGDIEGIVEPSSIAAADLDAVDLDANGTQDLAVTSFGANSLVLLRGVGQGRFTRQIDLPVGEGPRSVVVKDLNDDGAADLAVANETGGTVTVLVADTEGGYLPQSQLAVGAGPVGLFSGDFDDNGLPDLATANLESDALSVLTNHLGERADTNGTNRVDGFDIAALSLRAGCKTRAACVDDQGHPLGLGYRRDADVDLNGFIDGDDLAWVADRFGQLLERTSLRAFVEPTSPPPVARTVTFQPPPSEGEQSDLLRVQVIAQADDLGVAGARFRHHVRSRRARVRARAERDVPRGSGFRAVRMGERARARPARREGDPASHGGGVRPWIDRGPVLPRAVTDPRASEHDVVVWPDLRRATRRPRSTSPTRLLRCNSSAVRRSRWRDRFG